MQSIISPWNYGLRLTTSLRDTENTGVAGGLWCKIYGCERADRTALWKGAQNTIFCLRLGPHGTILEILWFQLRLYQSLSYSPKPKLTINVPPSERSDRRTWELTVHVCERGPLAPAALAWLLTVVNRVSFESSLFTSISANKTCAAARSPSAYQCCVVMAFWGGLCQKIGAGCWGSRLMVLLQTNYLTCQKFIPPSDGWSGGNNWPSLHPDCCNGKRQQTKQTSAWC